MSATNIAITPPDFATSLMASTSINASSANQNIEDETMLHLIKSDAALNIKSCISGNSYSNSATQFVCNANNYTSEELSRCEILSSPGLHDGSFAMSTYHDSTAVTNDSQTINFGVATCVKNKVFTVDEPTESIYDSHIKITNTVNDGDFFEDTSGNHSFKAHFDSSYVDGNGKTYHHFQKLLNSKFGNQQNDHPLYVEEATDFNTTYALAKQPNLYFTVGGTDGAYSASTLPTANQLANNKLSIQMTTTTLQDINETNFGTYRIQQMPDVPFIQCQDASGVALDSDLFPTHIKTDATYDDFQNATSSNTIRLDKEAITLNRFNSIFDLDNEVILPGYEFKMEIVPSENSGFCYDAQFTSKTNDLATIDDSALDDNIELMKNWISDPSVNCTLTYNPASVTINANNNGYASNYIDGSGNLVDASGNHKNVWVDTGRENLSNIMRATNGQFKINKRTVATRTTNVREVPAAPDATEILHPHIYYPEESYFTPIDTNAKVKHYAKYLSQLVFKNPVYGSKFLESNNDTVLNLIADNSIVNTNFDISNWNFQSFQSAQLGSADVWRILPQSRLDNVDSFKKLSDSTVVNNVFSTVYLENLKYEYLSGSIDGRAVLNLKKVSDLSMNSAFTTAQWSLQASLNNDTNNYLYSSSQVAYSSEGTYWPTIQQMNELDNGTTSSIDYTITFKPGKTTSINSNLVSDLADNITVTWGNNGVTQSLIVPLSDISKSIASSVSTPTIVNPNNYVTTGYLVGRSIDLVQITTVKTYQVKFNMRLRSYNNLYGITPSYVVQTVHYSIKDKVTGENYPSSMLQYISLSQSTTLPLTTNFTNIVENITSGGATTVSGSLTPNDIRELIAKVQMRQGNVNPGSWQDVTESLSISLFYSKNPLILRLNAANDISGTFSGSDVRIWLQYQYMTDSGSESDVLLNEQSGYFIQLADDYAMNYSLQHWTSSNANIGDAAKSTIGLNEQYIFPENGFRTLNGWSNSTHRLSVSFEDANDSTTVLTVIKNSDNTNQFIIKLKNNKMVNTPIYISRGKEDIWRVKSNIGNDLATSTQVEIFRGTVYDETSYLDGTAESISALNADSAYCQDRVALANGVFITADSLNFNTIKTPGRLTEFTLKPDMVSVNLVGTASTPVADLALVDELSFRYTNASNEFSKSLNFKYYRGYLGQQGVDQIYDIVRDVTTATWKWSKSSGDYYQVVDVYKSTQILNNLVFSVTPAIANKYNKLNLKLLFKYSMLADNDRRLHTIYSNGDTVQITVKNPNYTNTTVNIVKTLKSYILYTFGGTNYNSTSNHLILKSARLRHNSSLFLSNINNSTKSWTLKLISSPLNIYRIANDIGTPSLHMPLEQDASTLPTGWGSIVKTGYYTAAVAGLMIPGYTIKRIPLVNYSPSITYVVIARPRLRFTCMTHNVCPSDIPYDIDLASGNVKHFYMPVGEASRTYNPFAGTINITDITGSVTTYINDPIKTNNIIFTDLSLKVYSDYVANPYSQRHNILVKGTNVSIQLMLGLKNDVTSTLLQTLYEGPSSDLLDLDGTVNLKLLNSINNDSGVKLAFLQNSSPTYIPTNDNIFGLNNISNIRFTIPSFFANSSDVIKLDLPTGPGTKLTLYTRDIIKSPENNTYSVVLYKYTAITNSIDWNDKNITNKSVVNAVFNSRAKKVISIPARTLKQTGIDSFEDLLSQIPKSSISNINWSNDTNFSKTVWIAVCAMNLDCIVSTIPKFFSPPNGNGYVKMNIVTRGKFLVIKDKFGNVVGEINHDRILQFPFMSTGGLALQHMNNVDQPSNSSDIIQQSVLGFNRQIPN